MTKVRPDAEDKINLLRSQIVHRDYLRFFVNHIRNCLEQRMILHDVSKLGDSEFEGFASINAVAREHEFGSEEYKASLRSAKETIDEHYWNNTHHPQHFIDRGLGIELMSFLDIIEMVCDWAAAYKAYGSKGRFMCGVEKNMERFKGRLTAGQMYLVDEIANWLDSEFIHEL